MKFIFSLIVTGLLSFAACLYLPWWSITIAAFITSILIYQKPFLSFLSGFVALFILWGAMAWFISNNNGHLLAHKLSLIILKTDNPFVLIFATALIGALVAAFAALSGSLIRKPKQEA